MKPNQRKPIESPQPGAWEALVQKMLDGADPVETLGSRTEEGIPIRPLYSETEWAPPSRETASPSRETAPPQVVLSLEDVPVDRWPEVISEDLLRGAAGVWVPDGQTAQVGTQGDRVGEWMRKLEGSSRIFLDLSGTSKKDPASIRQTLNACHTACHSNGPSRPNWTFEWMDALDPERSVAGLVELLEWNRSEDGRESEDGSPALENRASWIVSGLPYHEAGAGPALELGATFAALIDGLRDLEAHPETTESTSPQAAMRCAAIRLGVSQEYFIEIAKLRALTRLWTTTSKTCNLNQTAPWIHACTSRRMLTSREPKLNILRQTQAAFAAWTGGAKVFSPLSHDTKTQTKSDWGRRIARNVPLILRDESRLAETADPATGSYFLESLTEQLAAAAWSIFQEIEAEGGLRKSLASGSLQDRLKTAATKRAAAIQSGDQKIVGENIYRHESGPEGSIMSAGSAGGIGGKA